MLYFLNKVRKVGYNAEEKAKVRADVTVQELMNIIVTEFNCSESSLYELVQKGANTVLETHKTLLENGIQSNEKLIFQYARNHSTSTDVPEGAVIIEDTQNRIYPIQWQPAIIGRKSMGTTEQNKLLAVDLYWLLWIVGAVFNRDLRGLAYTHK